jgi:hypothetical protein
VDPNATAANPNWRTALCHLFHVEVWPDGADVVAIEKNLRANLQTLAEMDPSAGAYLNEVRNKIDRSCSFEAEKARFQGIALRKRLPNHILRIALPRVKVDQKSLRSF